MLPCTAGVAIGAAAADIYNVSLLTSWALLFAGVRLDVDAERAEEQEGEQGGLADTLKAIVQRTMPCPRYVRFHEAHVQRYLSRLKAFPPRWGPVLCFRALASTAFARCACFLLH